MKKLKRTLALALTGCMAVSMLATGAFAAEAPAYSDVPANAAYAEAVEYLSAEKIMDGIGDGKFGPQNTVTRAMAVTVLGRMAGAEQVETRDFTDVVPNSWYSGYVGWASENGIVQGDGSGHFMPDRLVTSEQLNLMLDRYAALAGKSVELYDTGAATVTRADLAQRLYALETAATNSMPAVVHLDGKGSFGFGEGYLLGYVDDGVYTFKNIKYGTAERFKHSVANKEYGTAENPSFAMNNGPVPPQGGTRTESGKGFGNAAIMTPSDSDMFSIEADCLNLNVWTDSLDSSAKKPVLVFMHGGGHTEGSSIELKSYNGNYFADYTGVVFVSVNARLNTLGYSDLAAIGGDRNLGLGDMILSLEWVKDNIDAFGGDPDNVTIMGQSGGGGKVSALASSPKALKEGLFQKVVISSGFGASAATPESQDERALAVAADVKTSQNFIEWIGRNGAELGLGVTRNTTLARLSEIAANASNEIVFQYLQTCRYDDLPSMSFGTFTADGEYFDASGSLTADGLNETARNYTYFIGSCWGEMGMASSDGGVMMSDPTQFVGNMSEAQQKAAMEAWLENRVGGYDETKAAFEQAFPGHIFYDLRAGASRVNFDNDRYKAMAGLVTEGNHVYNYFSAYSLPMFGGLAMVHTVDLTYFFHSIDTALWQIHGDEANARKVADTMASALAAFCATGDPSTAELHVDPVTAEQAHTVIFDVESRCVTPDFDAELLRLIQTKPEN